MLYMDDISVCTRVVKIVENHPHINISKLRVLRVSVPSVFVTLPSHPCRFSKSAMNATSASTPSSGIAL